MSTLWVEFNFEFAPSDFGHAKAQNFSLCLGRYMIGQLRKVNFFIVPARPGLLEHQKLVFGRIKKAQNLSKMKKSQ